MWRRMRTALPALILVLAAGWAAAQTSSAPDDRAIEIESIVGRMVLVKTSGGGEFQGKILAAADDRLELIDGEGRIVPLYRPSIVSVAIVEPMDGGDSERDLFFRDAAANRLIVMPTAFAVERGELHITTQEVVIVTMSYGLTEHVSVWGGISVPGALANVRYALTPGDRFAVSFGAFTGMTWTDPQRNGVILPYVLTSFGDPNHNLTAAIAAPYLISEHDDPYFGGLMAAVGWKTIVSRTASVIVETWFYYDSDGGTWEDINIAAIPAVAFRIAGGRFSWDIGAFLPTKFASLDTGWAFTGLTSDVLIPLPILSLTYRLK